MAYGFVPMAYRQAGVTFIAESGRLTTSRLRQVVLSFEDDGETARMKYWGRCTEEVPLTPKPTCLPTETALNAVTAHIENVTEHKDIASGALLDTEGVFHRSSFNTTKLAAGRHRIEPAIWTVLCWKARE
jgi:hypothetical protein